MTTTKTTKTTTTMTPTITMLKVSCSLFHNPFSLMLQALEYAVKAQDELMKLQAEANKELGYLHMDYQNKMVKMCKQLEEAWRAEKIQKPRVHFQVLKSTK